MINKKLFCFAFLLIALLSIQFISATELKLIKVSELKEGYVIVDKNGNEIVVQKIISQETSSKSISQLVNEKVYDAEESISNSLTGFAIQTQEEFLKIKPTVSEKIKSFFARWFVK